MKNQIAPRRARRNRIVAGFAFAAAAACAAAGCSYFAQRPEVSPDKFAPPAFDREWTPAPASAHSYVVPAATRPAATLAGLGAPDGAAIHDLPALIDIALQNNPETRGAWDRARAAAASYGASHAPFYPVVGTQTSGGYERELIEIPGQTAAIKQWQVTPMIELTYTLLDFGRRSATAMAAREQLAAANFSFNRKMQDVVFATQRSFYAMGAAKAAVRAAEQNVDLAKTDDDAVSRRVDLGLATAPEWLLARQRVAQSEYDLASAQLLVREAQASMAVALGVAANSSLDVPSLDTLTIPTGLGREVEQLIETAIRERPDLSAQVATLDARRAEVERARAEFYPTIGVSGNYGEQNWGYRLIAPTTLKTSQPQYAGVMTVNWDIFTGFKRLNDVRAAEAGRDAANAQLKALEVDAIGSVWRAYYEFQTALKRYDYARALLAASREAYDANLDTYRQGLSTIVELLTADRDLAQARYTIVQSRADLLTSSAAVAYAVGAVEMPARR